MQERPQRLWFAILTCAIAGAFPIGIGLGVIPYDPAKLHAPPWVVVLAGGAFWLGALMMLARDRHRVANGLAFVLLLMFAAIGAWVSLLGEEAAFSDGAGTAVGGAGITLARIMFGFGSLLCLLMALVALRSVIRQRPS